MKCIIELNKKFYPEQKFPTNPRGFCTSLYCAFQKHGMINFTWSVLETGISIDELNEKEDNYITENNSLSPNGYNLKMNNKKTIGGYSFSDETRKKMSESSKKKLHDNLHKYRRKHAELKDVPQFVTYFESGKIRGYRIVRHPKCKSKQFADSATPVADLKRQLLEFMEALKHTEFKTVQQRKQEERGIPKGIIEQKPGKFLVCFSRKRIRYTKFFGTDTRDKNLQDAIEWQKNKLEEISSENTQTTDEEKNSSE